MSIPADLAFTGERFVPGVPGEIVYEHVHRYAFARRFATGRRVLDAACGEGYGSALLAQVAIDVVGVDVDGATIAHARSTYPARNLAFVEASVTSIPIPSGSIDLVVSFETIEHLAASDQPLMLAEFARVLAPEGVLLVSSPNRPEYSERRSYRNAFHVHELDRSELARLLAPHFSETRWYRQRLWLGSMLRSEAHAEGVELWEGDHAGLAPAASTEAMYFVVLAARSVDSIPLAEPAISLLSDPGETELARSAAHAREAIRLDGLAGERLAQLDRQMLHIEHLERLIGERDAEIRRREDVETSQRADARKALDEANGATAEAVGECERLQRALDAQERIIQQRQTLRWWFVLPWLRLRLAWKQLWGR
jgi:SAM-dependent methyltransferase